MSAKACPKCGKKVTQAKTGRPRKYCSPACRKARWRHDQGQKPRLAKWKS